MAIADALYHSLHGVNIAGVGTFYFNRSKHPDCSSTPLYDDNSNIGRRLVLGIELDSDTLNGNEENNLVSIGNGLYI